MRIVLAQKEFTHMILMVLGIIGFPNSVPETGIGLIQFESQAQANPARSVEIDSIIQIQESCGLPTLVVTPSRPGNPIQSRLVSALDAFLSPFAIQVVDQESKQESQERAADIAFADSNDAAKATRILLARKGDYELRWNLEVAVEDPEIVYGIETWRATAQLHATVSDLLIGRDIGTIDLETRSRRETRESAIDSSIESILDELGIRTERFVIDDWYGLVIGEARILVHCEGDGVDAALLNRDLSAIEGVVESTRLMPDSPIRFQVTGALQAEDIVTALRRGRAESCRLVILGSSNGSWFGLYATFLLSTVIVVYLLRPRRDSIKDSELNSAA